jgi:hypothetical protein
MRYAVLLMGRYYQFAPSIQVIDTGLYWRSDHETADIVRQLDSWR